MIVLYRATLVRHVVGDAVPESSGFLRKKKDQNLGAIWTMCDVRETFQDGKEQRCVHFI